MGVIPSQEKELIQCCDYMPNLGRYLEIDHDGQHQRPGSRGFSGGQWERRCWGGFRGFEKNRDEKISGIGGMSAAMPFRKREMIRGHACGT
jgi:hypothetical protein